MKVLYKPSFLKDLKRIYGTPEFDRIRKLAFEDVLNWSDLTKQHQVKRLTSKDGAYRVRVGDYRVGFFFSGRTVIFARALHRREIYRYFP